MDMGLTGLPVVIKIEVIFHEGMESGKSRWKWFKKDEKKGGGERKKKGKKMKKKKIYLPGLKGLLFL